MIKCKWLILTIIYISAFSVLTYAHTIDEPLYEGGMKYYRVNCENSNWDYIWVDGDLFYIDDSEGEYRQAFDSQKVAIEYICGEEEEF